MSYDKLNKSDQLKYGIMRDICDRCERNNGTIETCKQIFKGQAPTIEYDKLFKTYRLATTDCTKRNGYIYPTQFANKVRYPLTYHKTPARSKMMKVIIKLQKGLLYGGAGVGKTTLMTLIANKFHIEGYTVYFDSGANITKQLKDFNGSNVNDQLDLLQNVDMLFIDDMFRENLTQYVIMDIYNAILQYRIDNEKATFISTNYSIAEIEQIITDKVDKQSAEALCSRLKQLQIHRLEDRDYRASTIPDIV